MNHTLTAVQNLDLQRQRYWDEKLSQSAHNPWPLAPRDLVREGRVHYDNYLSENGGLTRFCSSHMMKEVAIILQGRDPEATNRLRMEIWGPGLGNRDLRWLNTAVEEGFDFSVRDISNVAMKNIKLIFHEFIKRNCIKIVVGDIEQTLETEKVDPRQTIAYFGSQFFQVLDHRKMRRALGELGLILSQWPCGIKPKPRIYIIHPLPEDNSGPKRWNGIRMPGVEWGDTTTYSRDELRMAVEHKLRRREVRVRVLGKHRYYHQTYSFLKLSLADA